MISSTFRQMAFLRLAREAEGTHEFPSCQTSQFPHKFRGQSLGNSAFVFNVVGIRGAARSDQ